jgi:hypothetical protein
MGGVGSGRPRSDDPKYIKSIRIEVSTLTKIRIIAEALEEDDTKIIRDAIRNHVDSVYNMLKNSPKIDIEEV